MMTETTGKKGERQKMAPARLLVANDKQQKESTDGENGKGRFSKKKKKKAAHGGVGSNAVFIQKSTRLR